MHTKKIASPTTTHAQVAGELQPRQFKLQAEPPRSTARETDLSIQLHRAERLGHTFSQVSVHPAPLQAATNQPSTSHLLIQPKIVTEEQKQDEKREELMRAGIVQAKLEPEQQQQMAASLTQLPAESGQPMPADVQTKMEKSFGTNFADVRIYEGMQAKAIGALAYAQGNQIHFAPGQYNPHTPSGQALLGHELTHIVQQRSGRVSAQTQTKGLPINADPALEQEADEMGIRAARGEPAPVPGSGVHPGLSQPKRLDLK